MSSENIVKRLEELLSAPCVEQKQTQEHAASTTTCTKQRQLRKIQPELIHASMRDHINARIAQTETADGTTNQPVQNSRTGRNQTIMHLRCLAASIYFWSPHVAREKKKESPNFCTADCQDSHLFSITMPIEVVLIEKNLLSISHKQL